MAESNLLCVILPMVAGQEQIEAILDPRCQIVMMSEEVGTTLVLLYDPSVQLNMVATNRKSLEENGTKKDNW